MKRKLLVLLLLMLVQWQSYAQDTTVTILPLQTLTVCPGDTLHARFIVNKRFQSGNTFSAELSSTAGNFATGTLIIGSRITDTNGLIICNIPYNIAAGNTYRIRILANNPARTSIDNGVDITIKPRPAIAPSAVKVCQNNIITLNAHSTTLGATVTWNGPLSYTGAGSPISIFGAQPNMSGKYYVTATLNGCSSYDSAAVQVNANPIALLTTNSPVCLGDTMHLNMNRQPATTNLVRFPDGSTIINSLNYSVLGVSNNYGGTYMLVVKDTNNCSDTTYQNFTVKPLPDTPDINSNSPICTGKKLQLSGWPGTTTNASFIWVGPGGFSSSSPTPFINNATAANAGVYTLRTFYNGCYSAPVNDTISIVDLPEKPIGSSNSPLCDGDGMQLTVKDVAGAFYLWTGPNNFKSNIQNPFLSMASTLATGYYVIRDSISGGCVNYDTIYVEVNPYPSKTKIIHNSPVCEGDTLKLHADMEREGTRYLWWSSNGLNDSTTDVRVPDMRTAKSGQYGVVANYRGCVTIGDTVDISTKPLPLAPTATSNGPLWVGQELMLEGTCPTSGVKFLWSGPNGFTDTGRVIYVTNMQQHQRGNYFVSADKDGCLATSSIFVDVRTLSTVKDVYAILYPSPNDGNFWLDIKTEEEQHIPISIHNLAGQLMYETKLPTNKKFLHQQFLLKGQMAGGRYYLTAIVDGKKLHLPFVVNRN